MSSFTEKIGSHRFIISVLSGLSVLLFAISLLNIRSYAASNTTWQEEYEYTLDDSAKTITLNKFTSTEECDVYVPAKAVINGKEYGTIISAGGEYPHYTGCYEKTNIKSFSVEKGVKLYTGYQLFKNCKKLEKVDVKNLDTSGVSVLKYMFYDCESLKNLDLSSMDTSKVTEFYGVFYDCKALETLDISGWDTGKATDMTWLFYGCSSLKNIDISNLNTKNVKRMEAMFCGCRSLTSLDLSNLDTGKVGNMESMFTGCTSLTSIDISNFVMSSSNTSLRHLFTNCLSLTDVKLGNIDTSNVRSMSEMFQFCESLKKIDLSSLDTSSLENMYGMFCGCESLESIDLNIDTSKVTNIEVLFAYCKNLKSVNLSNTDLSSVKFAGMAFAECDSLTEIKTPKVLSTSSDETKLPDIFLDENGNEYTVLEKCPVSTTLVRKEKEEKRKDILDEIPGLSKKYVPEGYVDNSGSPMKIEGKDLSWNDVGGKSYWYEGGVKQGTYYDPKGVLGLDRETGEVSNRGREICDNSILDDNRNGTWFWLDSCYDGAKAVGKEVWIPYIYQDETKWNLEQKREIANESDPGMEDLVYYYMIGGNGKWVRYDENGRMLKGWVTIEGALAEKYPDQIGNTYYYDTRTGLMAKGKITIDGVEHFFDETTGVKQY